jgi:hypothetical protein
MKNVLTFRRFRKNAKKILKIIFLEKKVARPLAVLDALSFDCFSFSKHLNLASREIFQFFPPKIFF